MEQIFWKALFLVEAAALFSLLIALPGLYREEERKLEQERKEKRG